MQVIASSDLLYETGRMTKLVRRKQKWISKNDSRKFKAKMKEYQVITKERRFGLTTEF